MGSTKQQELQEYISLVVLELAVKLKAPAVVPIAKLELTDLVRQPA